MSKHELIDEILDKFFRPDDPRLQPAAIAAADQLRARAASPRQVFAMICSAARFPRDAAVVQLLIENRDYCERYIAGVLGYA